MLYQTGSKNKAKNNRGQWAGANLARSLSFQAESKAPEGIRERVCNIQFTWQKELSAGFDKIAGQGAKPGSCRIITDCM